MSILHRVRSLFIGGSGRSLRVLEARAATEDLDIDELGRVAGGQNEPHPTATSPDANEQKIRARFGGLLASLKKNSGDELVQAQVEREQLLGRFSPDRFTDLLNSAKFELDTLRSNAAAALRQSRAVERRALRALRAFKARHGLHRDAEYPENRALFYAGIAIAIVLEGAANTLLFAMGSPYGLIGGLQEALLIAALNVLLSYHVGVALCGLNCRGARRFGTAVLGVAFIAGLIVFHAAVGHYRAALTGPSPETAVTTAIFTLKTDPAGALNDLHTWLLMLVGALAALGAAVAGYHSDDRYPGYGRAARRYLKALRVYEAEQQTYRDGIQAVGGDSSAKVDAQTGESEQGIEAYRANSTTTAEAMTEYELQARGLETAHVGAIQRYRKANREVRNTPAPAYFDELPTPFGDEVFLDIGGLSVAAPAAVAKQLQAATEAARRMADGSKQDIRNLVSAQLRDVPEFVHTIEREIDLMPPSSVVGSAVSPAPAAVPPAKPAGSNGHDPTVPVASDAAVSSGGNGPVTDGTAAAQASPRPGQPS